MKGVSIKKAIGYVKFLRQFGIDARTIAERIEHEIQAAHDGGYEKGWEEAKEMFNIENTTYEEG